MQPALIIFSGLPGTGKSTLANRLARELRSPLLRIDDVAGPLPEITDIAFWDSKIALMLELADVQLELGLSIVLDSVFMGSDRLHAQQLAHNYAALFRPVYCFVSDEAVWQQRVTERFEALQNGAVATWERILEQRKHFQPREQGTALFIDAVAPLEQTYAALLEFVTQGQVGLSPLPVDTPLVKGSYHG